MPVEPPFCTYREKLWPLYQGLALWKPSPGDLYDRVSIGDVGYVYEGAFIRMFNVRLPWDDESNRQFGIPDPYDPLGVGHLSIRRETFENVEHYSRCVSRDENANNLQAASPDQADGVAYSCQGRGALLSLPHGGHREDAVQMKIFEKYIQDNVVSWFTWAQKNQLGVERMEDLILVSGCTLVTTWAAAVFTDHILSAEISLASIKLSNGGASFVWSNVRGPIAHHNSRFDPQSSPTSDQCVFIKGFRAKRVLFRIKPLRAAAEPLPDDPDNRRDGDIFVTAVPGVPKYRDPLTGVLDYIAEKCIEGAFAEDIIAIAHDDDLHLIEDIKAPTADEIEKHLHERNMPLLVETGAAMLRVPRNNISPVSNEKQVAPYEAAESNKESMLFDLHNVLTDYHLKPEMTGYINNNHDPPNTSLLHIPPELIIRILQYLPPGDIISCRRTCRTMYDICNVPYLRYLVQMERCGVSDDLRPILCYFDRLRILERHEEAWGMLDFRNSVQIDVPFDSSGIYDFTGGTLLLGTRTCGMSDQFSAGYSYISLPSVEQGENLQWIERDIGIKILDIGLAVHEHDLIAALMAKADDGGSSDRLMTLEIRLLRFSTGQPHPLAEQPIIFITRKSQLLGPCSIHIEIVGDFLALFIAFPWVRSEQEDMFFLVRWKKGEAHCLRSFKWGACAHFSFLSQDTLVIPNLIQNTLELVKIAVKSDDIPCLFPLCVLNLPPLTRRASIVRLGCRAEPNPTGPGPQAIPASSNRPFRDSAEDAIVLFNVLIEDSEQFSFPQARPFTFIVHRRALLNHIPAAHRACAPFCSTPGPAPETMQVPWEAWGSLATRWFEGDPASMRWITTTAGQRAVTMEDGVPTPIIVRDFNPYAVRSARARAAAGGHLEQWCDWSEDLPNGNVMAIKVEDSVLAAGSVFKNDVRSSLPYVEVVTRAKYRYQGVLIDEERILGLKTTQDDKLRISSFDVHILG